MRKIIAGFVKFIFRKSFSTDKKDSRSSCCQNEYIPIHTFSAWLWEIDRRNFRNRNHQKDRSSLSDPSLPFWAKGPKTIDRRGERQQSHLSSSSFSLSPSNSFLDLPPNCSREHQFLVKLRESKAVEILSYLSYRDRGSIYTIPVFLSYLPTHRRLLLLVVERSRSLDEGRRQAHDKERERKWWKATEKALVTFAHVSPNVIDEFH